MPQNIELLETSAITGYNRCHENNGLTNLWPVNPLVKPDLIVLAAISDDCNAHIVDTPRSALVGLVN